MLSLELIKDYLVSVSDLHVNDCDHLMFSQRWQKKYADVFR